MRRNSAQRDRDRAALAKAGAPCHICGQPIDYSLPTYCNNTCGSRYASRRNYRLKVGIPLDAPLYQSDKPQWRRTWVA